MLVPFRKWKHASEGALFCFLLAVKENQNSKLAVIYVSLFFFFFNIDKFLNINKFSCNFLFIGYDSIMKRLTPFSVKSTCICRRNFVFTSKMHVTELCRESRSYWVKKLTRELNYSGQNNWTINNNNRRIIQNRAPKNRVLQQATVVS